MYKLPQKDAHMETHFPYLFQHFLRLSQDGVEALSVRENLARLDLPKEGFLDERS